MTALGPTAISSAASEYCCVDCLSHIIAFLSTDRYLYEGYILITTNSRERDKDLRGKGYVPQEARV